MKTLVTTFFGMLFMAMPAFSTQLSEYCDTPTGHLSDPNFGDPNGRILLTITKINDNSLALIVKPTSDEVKKIDFLQVNVKGLPPIIVGEDEGVLLDEYKAIITFDGEVPEYVEIPEILWSNTDWTGRWVMYNTTVPFDAACDVEFNDDIAPVMTEAKVVEELYNSVKFELKATDKDNEDKNTNVSIFIFNDEANDIIDKTVKADADNYGIINGLNINTKYNFTVKAKDEAGNISENSIIISASTLSLPENYIIDNFEGEAKAWNAVEGGHDVSVVDNPLKEGINTSAFALKGGRDANAANWAATMLRDLNIPGGYYKYLHVMMYRDVVSTYPNAKMSDTAGGDISPVEGQIMKAGIWQDIVFDISAIGADKTVDFLYYMYDRGVLPSNQTAYLDDIVLNNSSEPRSMTTSLSNDISNNRSVYAIKNILTVKGFEGADLQVYSSTGRLELQKQIKSQETLFELSKGLYLIVVDSLKYKVIIE